MLKFKVLADNFYAVEGDTHQEVAKLFVRFQECYESPKFRNKVFTLDEFKAYYKDFKGSKKFTYYDDWTGFNVPSHIVDKFALGKFNPTTAKERWLIDEIMKVHHAGKFYVIGYKKGSSDTLKHERAHAMYYSNSQYKLWVDHILLYWVSNEDEKKLTDHLKNLGYHSSVIRDEIHAYILCEKSYLKKEKIWNTNLNLVKHILDNVYKEHR